MKTKQAINIYLIAVLAFITTLTVDNSILQASDSTNNPHDKEHMTIELKIAKQDKQSTHASWIQIEKTLCEEMPTGVDPVKWGELRLVQWYDGIDRLHYISVLIESELNAEDPPLMNVPLPKGAAGVPGANPNSITDPNLRAEYEAAIKKNGEKTVRWRELRALQRTESDWFMFIRKHIMFNCKTMNRKELLELIEKEIVLNKDQTFKKSLIEITQGIKDQR